MKELASAILSSYMVATENVRIVLDVESVPFTIDDATPCGLIINELMTNSLKYAFPGEREGEIRISLHRSTRTECFCFTKTMELDSLRGSR